MAHHADGEPVIRKTAAKHISAYGPSTSAITSCSGTPNYHKLRVGASARTLSLNLSSLENESRNDGLEFAVLRR